MENTITVTGTGQLSLAPNQIEIHITLNALQLDFGQAMKEAKEKVAALQKALDKAGFKARELKTVAFNTESRYHYEASLNGQNQRVFEGYDVMQEYLLKMKLDSERLAKTLQCLSDSGVDPQLQIRFTLKDQNKAREKLLQNAVRDSAEKAQIIAGALKRKLGECLSVNYHAVSQPLYSDYIPQMETFNAKASAVMDFNPNNIELQDTVTTVWALV